MRAVAVALLGLALPLVATAPAAAQSEAVHPLTSVDEVVDAVEACLAATTSEFVNLDTLANAGWRIGEAWGDSPAMRINNYNKAGSNADIMVISVANRPSLQCSAIGRFSGESSFAELDDKLETLFTGPPDSRDTATQETGDRTEIASWNLAHNSIVLSRFYGRNSAMIVVRYR